MAPTDDPADWMTTDTGVAAGIPWPVSRVELAPGYTISRVVKGGWQLASDHGRGAPDPEAAIADMFRFVEAGITTFDCADIYTGVEKLIGRFLEEYRRRSVERGDDRRDGIQVHTKFVPDLEVLPRITRDYVERIVDRSLRRLGVERLDLVQFAWWDYDVPGYVETAGWLQELVGKGKIRHLGATNFDLPRLREFVEAGIDLVAHQVQYSLLDRRPERGMAGAGRRMVDFCREHDIGLLCYGTLAGGFLTRRWSGVEEPREPPESLANRSLTKYRLIIDEYGGWDLYQELLAALDSLARRHGVDPAAVALRWVLDRPGVAAVVVGARTGRHLDSTLEAFDPDLLRGGPEERSGVEASRVEGARSEDSTGGNSRVEGTGAKDSAAKDVGVGEPGSRGLEALRRVLERAQGPEGAVYGLERDRHGRHGRIMKYDLNRDR